ncbi:DNA cytosine methyltransferase (plasmid) [Rhizobium leguminosarum bv. trifolii]|uniref:DNA cytosine methyltransferase n=1 Tax=Rhizobium ruizarguesonis TaxID=2081791 RepID=UPI001030004B|nr:DNA cytosine methyltransferase [Rhizobium ruizarguesonis]QIO48167.1 DNA cytosine methyltransferase [Rhizobium leguminosarum bv. trifolii]TAW39109.1 DNA cytosine methyltransferase [Rhizobium ruizarguesonis]TAY06462.1 DNA cytosine methyltransferase [Rhizobium ruizarguesonis]
MTKLTFADLFSGCGGLSLGLTLSGLQGRFAIERDGMAFRTFATNMLEWKGARRFDWPRWLEQKAWDIEELLDQHLADLRSLRGQIDILAGGPPCQGFSFAGRRNEDDPRNLLFKKYVEMVQALQPQAIVIENVPGMKVVHARRNVVDLQNPNRGEKKVSFYDKLVESLLEAGYVVEAKLVDSSAYGVPQKRSRLIVIGVKKDLCEWLDGGISHVFQLLENARLAQLKELGLGEVVTAADALSDLEINGRTLSPATDPECPKGFLEAKYEGPTTPYQELMHFGHEGPMDSMRLARHRDDVRERFGKILAECRRGVRMSDASRKSYNLKKHRIFPMAGHDPAPTVTTLPDDILHYSEPRILTVREYARLQSFPDWFHFRGKYTTGGKLRTKECPRYTQVGNAVPPLLARAIGNALQQMLAEVSEARGQFARTRQAEAPALAVG